MSAPRRRRTPPFAVARCAAGLLTAALLAAACSGPEATVVRAAFDDVIDLTENGAVKIADVTVGHISEVELTEDLRALVTMEVSGDVDLPSSVRARLRKTSVLGERFVELVPDPDSGGTLESGTLITDTQVVPELEEVIATSTDLLVAISADVLAGAIEAGATGLDGRGQTFGGLLEDLEAIVGTYDANSDDLVRLLVGLDEFLDTVGPQADLHGEALATAAEFTRVLGEEDDRLIDTLVEVQDLAVTGTDIIDTHRQRFDDFVTRLVRLTDELREREGDLDRLFVEVSGHNFHTIRGVNQEHAQVVLDFISCGINDRPGDPIRACEDPPSGAPAPQPRPPQDY